MILLIFQADQDKTEIENIEQNVSMFIYANFTVFVFVIDFRNWERQTKIRNSKELCETKFSVNQEK